MARCVSYFSNDRIASSLIIQIIFLQSCLSQNCKEGSFWQLLVSVHRYNNNFLLFRVEINIMAPIGTTKYVPVFFQDTEEISG